MKNLSRIVRLGVVVLAFNIGSARAQQRSNSEQTWPAPQEANFVVHDFQFRSGEALRELRIHYRTLGKPARDADGRTTNAVLILHGTGGDGTDFLDPIFAGVLFGSGQLLDATKYFLILPDNLGHGGSSKPSDGLHAHFPHYNYADMVALQHELVTKDLGIDHLRLILGTSMGCMHSWLWAEAYPDFMDALMPLACQAVQVAGRNRIWRKMIIDGIQQDPDWKGGEYSAEPQAALRIAADLLAIAGSAPLHVQKDLPTRDAADKYLDAYMKRNVAGLDANDLLYAISASRDYDPSPKLEGIKAHVLHINSADDFVNPPELGIAEREIKRVKNGKFVLLPASEQTHGHGTHTYASVWQHYLRELLDDSSKHSRN